nr:uncharacterized protein LOC121119584 [Lepeophtheirus salmonis]
MGIYLGFFITVTVGLSISRITESAVILQRKAPMNVVLMFPSNDSICYNQTRVVNRVKVDETVECKEIYTEKCIPHPKTFFNATKVKVCTETFKENCNIKYSFEHYLVNVTVCKEKDKCDPREVCTDVHQTGIF